MKLTPELLTRAPSSLNTLGDRTLDLRGLKLPAIENLGVTRDQNDAIDFTDNDIRYLGNFPLLSQLQHVQLANNLVARIDARLGTSLPALRSLTLTNNAIAELGEVAHLATCARLEFLDLMGNPVAREKHYREFVVWKLPSVRVLDYQRVRDKERALARELMETEDGRPSALAASILRSVDGGDMDVDAEVGKKRTFEPGRLTGSARRVLTPEERKAIEEAIDKSESLDEIRRLEEQLKMRLPFTASS